MNVKATGILKEWLEKDGLAALVDDPQGFEVVEQDYKRYLVECAKSHPDYDTEHRHAWAVFNCVSRKTISKAEQQLAGEGVVPDISRVARSADGIGRDFRALRGSFEALSEQAKETNVALIELREAAVINSERSRVTCESQHAENLHCLESGFDLVSQSVDSVHEACIIGAEATRTCRESVEATDQRIAESNIELNELNRAIAKSDKQREEQWKMSLAYLETGFNSVAAAVEQAQAASERQWKWARWLIIGGIALLMALVGIGVVKAEPEPKPTHLRSSDLAVRYPNLLAVPQVPHDPLLIEVQDEATRIKLFAAGVARFNCVGAGVSCTVSGNTVSFNISGGGAASAWSSLTDPSANLSLAHAAFTTTFTWGATTGAGIDLFQVRDTASNTGTGYIFSVNTATSSAAKPLRFTSGGTANGVEMSTAGRLQKIGTGTIDTTHIQTREVDATAPNDGQLLIWNAGTTKWVPGDPIVSGPAAEGATPANNPVWVAGTGTDGFIRALRLFDLDSGAGAQWAQGVNLRKIASGGSVEAGTATDPLRVDVTGTTTQPVSGTVTVTDGAGALNVIVDSGSITANAGTNLNTSLLGLESTQSSVLTSVQKIDNIAHAGADIALVEHVPLSAQFDDTATTTVTENNIAPLRITSGRALHVAQQGTVTVSGTVTANAGSGTFIVGDGAGALNVIVDSSALPTGAPTLAEQQTQTTALQIIDNLPLAQGSTTSGQSGALVMGAVTTAAPTYTTAQTSPLSLTTAGDLRVSCTNCSGSGASHIDNNAFTGGTDDIAPMGALFDTTPPAITDGNAGIPRMNSNRILMVDCQVGCSGSSFADNSAFTFGTTVISPMGAVVDDTATNTVAENSAGTPRMSTNRVLYVDLIQTQANATAIKVDGSAVTQPVSGTVTVGTFPDNEPFNVAQINGVTPLMGNGVTGTGSQRVTIASDNTAFTVNIGTFPDNEPINVAQINGVTPLMGNGVTGTGSHRVTISSDNSAVSGMGVGATGSAVPANANYIAGAGTANTTGYINCDNYVVYDAATNGNTELVALTASQKVYVCGFTITTSSSTAVTVRLVRGTGTACATGETSVTPGYVLQSPASVGPTGVAFDSGMHRGLASGSGEALCIETNAAVAVQALVLYTKF